MLENGKLTNISVLYEQAAKAVYTADSAEFGPIILKRDRNPAQLRSEYEMLSRLAGRHCCRVYAFDEIERLLAEERILPGTSLREERSLDARLKAFTRVFQGIHTPAGEGDTYLDWLASAEQFCKTNTLSADWQEKAGLACSLCRELFETYTERVLLHGDLHHDNILLRSDGSYAMIDPKGVIGPAILDLPRFILNEIDTAYAEPPADHIAVVITLLCERLGYPLADVGKAFVMETILANIWRMEDGEPVCIQQLEIAESILEWTRSHL